jgi:hypothetical protein
VTGTANGTGAAARLTVDRTVLDRGTRRKSGGIVRVSRTVVNQTAWRVVAFERGITRSITAARAASNRPSQILLSAVESAVAAATFAKLSQFI